MKLKFHPNGTDDGFEREKERASIRFECSSFLCFMEKAYASSPIAIIYSFHNESTLY